MTASRTPTEAEPREALDDAMATIAAVRAASRGDDWAESADHFHTICGETLALIAALRSTTPASDELPADWNAEDEDAYLDISEAAARHGAAPPIRRKPNLPAPAVAVDDDASIERLRDLVICFPAQAVARLQSLQAQIDKLAEFIMHKVPGEPIENQGAVDTAIRIIASLQAALAANPRS
jgi:hypothetical protein